MESTIIYWLFMGRYCESLGQIIKGQWLKFGPEIPAAIWTASQCDTRFEQAKCQRTYSRKSTNFSERGSGKVKHWFS
jgi:hypothetical protein